jgi:cell division protein FtsW
MLQRGPFTIPFRILVLALLLTTVGLVMVYSSSAFYAARQKRLAIAKQLGPEAVSDDLEYHSTRYLLRQGMWLGLGLAGLIVAYYVDYRRLHDFAPYILGASCILLILVFVPGVGKVINDHRRWVGFGSFTIQPSEIAKLALIVYMSGLLVYKHDTIRDIRKGVVPVLAITGFFVCLTAAEPDLGAAMVMAAIMFFMWFIAGMRWIHLFGMVAGAGSFFSALIVFFFPDRLERIISFLFPTVEHVAGKGFQLRQSLIAVGSGGMWGVGLGNSMQKYFLNEQFSDFMFAIVGEELGFVWTAAVVVVYFLLILEGWNVALKAPDFYAKLLASGITLMLAISVTLNLMVVLGMAPTKGLALPFLSYGGTNLLVTLTAVGILMNIGKYIELEAVPAASRKNKPARAPRRPASAKSRDWRSVVRW